MMINHSIFQNNNLDYSKLSYSEIENLFEYLSDLHDEKLGRFIDTFYPTLENRNQYLKHMAFYEAGATFNFRLFLAANRSGKTISGLFETTCHATGVYPDWWKGKRFDKPLNILVCGKKSDTVRDILQFGLLGRKSTVGTGMIPREYIGKIFSARGVVDAVDYVEIKHISGGLSVINFKSYTEGRDSFEGTTYDLVWFDEEPPLDVYAEAITRTATVEGIVYLTFTPLEGPTPLILSYLNPPTIKDEFDDSIDLPSGAVIQQGWTDVPHLTEKIKKLLLSKWPTSQHDARTKGIPVLGSGAIYGVPEDEFVIKPVEIPKWWRKIYGLDTGSQNTAAVWLAIDPDTDIYYIYSNYKKGIDKRDIEDDPPFIHAQAIKARGDWIPGAIDYAGTDQSDGQRIKDIYIKHGLLVENADKRVEAGLLEVLERLSLGRLKVFNTCEQLLEEYRVYHRNEKGHIVKKNDHLMDAMRYAVMSAADRAKTQVRQNIGQSRYQGSVGL